MIVPGGMHPRPVVPPVANHDAGRQPGIDRHGRQRHPHHLARAPVGEGGGKACIDPEPFADHLMKRIDLIGAADQQPVHVLAGQPGIVERAGHGVFQQPDGGNAGRYSRLASGGRVTSSATRSEQVETLTWQQSVDRLNQLGIRTFRLTPDSGQNGYRFVCLVTSVDDPRISRRFEAESIDPLIAVGDVLAQVENWNLHR